MTISQLIVWFGIGAFVGWIIESAYHAIRTGHWEKRGFLGGPICPIYGVGTAMGLGIFSCLPVLDGTFPWWGIFLISVGMSGSIEYVTSYVLEKAFGAVWWDYSKAPLNINGRICLPTLVFFGLGGIFAAYIVLPVAFMMADAIPSVVFEAAALIIVASVAADTALTLTTLTDLMQKLNDFDEAFNAHMENTCQNASSTAHKMSSTARRYGSGAMNTTKTALGKQREIFTGSSADFFHRQRVMLGRMKRFRNEHLGNTAKLIRKALDGMDQNSTAAVSAASVWYVSPAIEPSAYAIRQNKPQHEDDFEKVLGDLPTTARVASMDGFTQHGKVTTLVHTTHVAQLALSFSRKTHMDISEEELVRGALLHDYFLYDWHHSGRKGHALYHPITAAQNAKEDFDLTDKEINIITSHMWPLPPTRIPRSREAWLVCMADKCCSLHETLFKRR